MLRKLIKFNIGTIEQFIKTDQQAKWNKYHHINKDIFEKT